MPIKNALASVAVADLSSCIAWYEKLFERKADSRPMAEVAEWKFPGGGWLQVYQSSGDRVGKGSVTLAVSSLSEQIAAMKELGIEAGAPMDGEKVKVVMLKDPDGNSIAFAEALERSMAQ